MGKRGWHFCSDNKVTFYSPLCPDKRLPFFSPSLLQLHRTSAFLHSPTSSCSSLTPLSPLYLTAYFCNFLLHACLHPFLCEQYWLVMYLSNKTRWTWQCYSFLSQQAEEVKTESARLLAIIERHQPLLRHCAVRVLIQLDNFVLLFLSTITLLLCCMFFSPCTQRQSEGAGSAEQRAGLCPIN